MICNMKLCKHHNSEQCACDIASEIEVDIDEYGKPKIYCQYEKKEEELN